MMSDARLNGSNHLLNANQQLLNVLASETTYDYNAGLFSDIRIINMKLWSGKTFRNTVNVLLFFLPKENQISIDRWLRGRKEFHKLKDADCVIISFPKSGRTWLRVMLSRFFQSKFGINKNILLGFDNYHHINPGIPRILFTHDNIISDYTGIFGSKKDYHGKKVILLVRDPRDVVVSQFFQYKYRIRDAKKKLYSHLHNKKDLTILEFTLDKQHGLPPIIEFLNNWHRELPNIKDSMVIRYEDIRKSPEKSLASILEFIGTPGTTEDIEQAVAYAEFHNLQKLEKQQSFTSSSRRMMAGDKSNPDSYKVRRAKVGGYTDYFNKDELEQIEKLLNENLTATFGYNP